LLDLVDGLLGDLLDLADRLIGLSFGAKSDPTAPRTKKADVAEHPKAFDHVGLLVNEPPGTAELLFI
jgi:hypothetical protein